MRTPSNYRTSHQAGFTLIELVVVIVIIGILAAVAIPKLGTAADEARKGKATATLGALKSGYSIVYAQTKVLPTCALVAAQMADPICTVSGTTITCPGVQNAGGTADTTFTCAAATLASSAGITCTTAADCL